MKTWKKFGTCILRTIYTKFYIKPLLFASDVSSVTSATHLKLTSRRQWPPLETKHLTFETYMTWYPYIANSLVPLCTKD